MTDGAANPVRGEAAIIVAGVRRMLRPSFAALVATEGELGSLFGLVERASAGGLTLGEMAGLFWHCLDGAERPSREAVGEAVVAMGLARCAPVLRVVLGQVLAGVAE